MESEKTTLLETAAHLGWPAITMVDGRRVGGAENAWRSFERDASEVDVAIAHASLLQSWSSALGM